MKQIIAIVALFVGLNVQAQEQATINSATVSGLSFRNIGPALTSGRVADIAVNRSPLRDRGNNRG